MMDLKEQQTIVKNHKKLETNCSCLHEKVKMLQKDLNHEKYVRNNLENNSRKLNVEITGIPVLPDENCKSIVFKIGKLMGVDDIKYKSIDVSHRLMSDSAEKIPPINARFISRTERDAYYSKRSGLKLADITNIGFKKTNVTAKSNNKIYINESLSIDTKIMFKDCRAVCARLGYRHCFTSGGVIYIKRDQTSQRIRINTTDDFNKIR